MRNAKPFFGWRGGAVVALAAIVAGCSGKPDLPPVTGVVTQGGQPLAGVNVIFTPVNKGIASGAITGPDGRFELKANDGRLGAEAGAHRVTVLQPTPELPPPGPDSTPPPPQAPPLEYHTEIEVKAEGDNNVTIDVPQ